MKLTHTLGNFVRLVRLGSNANKDKHATDEIEAKKAPIPKAEEKTFDELLLSEAE